jgi:hypothetical protein
MYKIQCHTAAVHSLKIVASKDLNGYRHRLFQRNLSALTLKY